MWVPRLNAVAWALTDVFMLIYKNFIDLQKAFVKVPREGVRQLLSVCNVMDGLRNAIRTFYNDTNNQVRTLNVQSSCFKTTKGVRQRSILSSFLFVIVINKVIWEVDGHVKKLTVSYRNLERISIHACAFADSVMLLARITQNLQHI